MDDEVVTRGILRQELRRELNRELKRELSKELAVMFGQITQYLDKRLSSFEAEMRERSDKADRRIDTLMGRTDTDEAERAALGHQLDRHKSWISQLADGTKTKLTPSID